jgi:Na+/melibiose symporter-like transporter
MTNQTLANMKVSDLMPIVDQLATKNDRWLFIAALIVLGVFVWFVLRSFMRQHERLIEDHKKARNEYQSSLRKVVAEQSAANQKLIQCLNNNSKVLRECRDELRLRREERNV